MIDNPLWLYVSGGFLAFEYALHGTPPGSSRTFDVVFAMIFAVLWPYTVPAALAFAAGDFFVRQFFGRGKP